MRLFSLVLLSLLWTSTLVAQPAYVHGTVHDPAGAVLVAAPVQVTSDSARCETKTNERGEFNCSLPPGNYVLRSAIPFFFPYTRALNLPSGHSFVKIRTVVTASSIGFTVDETGAHNVISPPGPAPKIEERIVGGTDVLIRYKDMNASDGLIFFRGPYLMLTSNLLAVYAKTIACTETFHSCAASGAVRIETGTQEDFEGTQADIDLLNHKFKLTRTAIVEHSF